MQIQEQMNSEFLSLVMKCARPTAHNLAVVMRKLLNGDKTVVPRGKMSISQLNAQGHEVQSAAIEKADIKIWTRL